MVICLAFAGLGLRLVDVHVVSSERYADVGRQQRFETKELVALRGTIYDRNGAALAITVPRVAVWADPRLVVDPRGTAQALAEVLDADEQRLYERLTATAGFVYLAHRLDESVAEAVRSLNRPGIGFEADTERIAPAGSLGMPVLGVVGNELVGLSGLEKQYEGMLVGTPGRLMVERGPTGDDIAGGERERVAPRSGADVHLTIDRDLQWAVEEALADQVKSTNARRGMAVIMDPRSGEILAIANVSREGGKVVVSDYNMALVDVFEPGSVTKLVTMAAALEEGVVSPGERFSVPDRLRVSDAQFTDAETHPDAWWRPEDIMAESSNVGTIMIAQRLGAERLDRYLRAFGFAGKTGLDFPGEAGGLVPTLERWSGTTLATLAIGQGMALNAVQLLTSFNTIANGGEHIEPTLVRRVVDEDGAAVALDPPTRSRIVSPETARTIAGMLAKVVEHGTGSAATIEGYSVAGKTGTARKAVEGVAGYKDGAYVASFAGFVPAGAPRLSAVVVLDEPTPYTGSQAAAPLFAEISRFALRHYAVPPAPSEGWTLPGSPGSPGTSPAAPASGQPQLSAKRP